MQKGISFTAWWSGQYREPGADLSLGFLASTGANWIALIVTAHQETYTSTTIDSTDVSTPTDEDLIHVIDKAHSLGLKVMLKPHLDLRDETATGYWRGDIGSGFTTEAQWSAWFASYRNFIEHYEYAPFMADLSPTQLLRTEKKPRSPGGTLWIISA
jgi:hypothetical protein